MAKVWKTPLQAKTQVSWEVLSVLSPQQAQPLLQWCPGTPWFLCPAWLRAASPSLGSSHPQVTAGSSHHVQLI